MSEREEVQRSTGDEVHDGQDTARPDAEAPDAEAPDAEAPDAEDGGEEQIRLTPGLVILGVLAVALGVFAGLVMSAQALGR